MAICKQLKNFLLSFSLFLLSHFLSRSFLAPSSATISSSITSFSAASLPAPFAAFLLFLSLLLFFDIASFLTRKNHHHFFLSSAFFVSQHTASNGRYIAAEKNRLPHSPASFGFNSPAFLLRFSCVSLAFLLSLLPRSRRDLLFYLLTTQWASEEERKEREQKAIKCKRKLT